MTEGLPRQLVDDVSFSFRQGVGHEDALPSRESVGLDHPRGGETPQEGNRRSHLGEGSKSCRWDTGVVEQFLHEGLRALELRSVGTRTNDEPSHGPKPIGQAIDERSLGSNDDEVAGDVLWSLGGAGEPIGGDAWVPRRHGHRHP